jgi:hypothetical protein
MVKTLLLLLVVVVALGLSVLDLAAFVRGDAGGFLAI